MKIKQTKDQLKRKLAEALATQTHVYHFADAGLDKAGAKFLMGSGVVLTLTVLGGRELIPPTLIRDGLSDELVSALRSEFLRSYDLATLFKPKGAK